MKIERAAALVTGANRGIGLAFARELLARNLHHPGTTLLFEPLATRSLQLPNPVVMAPMTVARS
jgi:NADP-dependent 3-hydroxy acid dehydrogenase YdfG